MKTNIVLITALFAISLFGYDNEDDLLIGKIESRKVSFEKPASEEKLNLSEYN